MEKPVKTTDLLVVLFALTTLILSGCSVDDGTDPEEDEIVFEMQDDCYSQKNDVFEDAFLLPAENRFEATEVRLCNDDIDHYRVEVPAGRWLSLKMTIDGDGSGGDDLDMYEVNEDGEELWGSFASQPFERLAWYNPSSEPVEHTVRIEGYNGGDSDYDLLMRIASWHEGLDCDDFYPDTANDTDGQCNRIMQFPQANDEADGHRVQHQAHYSNLRREVAYLVRYATSEVAREFGDTNPLGLLDMSQWDGDVPGRMVGQLRHPEGTHVGGNDIDIAYYMNSGNNLGGYACSSHDNYFCTGPANLMDTERTTYLLAKLMESPNVRVIGVDPEVAEKVLPMAYEMEDEGLISSSIRGKIVSRMAYGDGWPFHHHHLHFSWNWEDGFEGREAPVDGCITEDGPDYLAERFRQ
ncbi:MAG: hypothetical protein VX498_07845 [Myxococcota bacterium]|nr:hypothetical protein [Myxococcota bacterium]